MYKNILLPVDGSELSEKAVMECVRFAKSAGAKVTVIHAVSRYHLNYSGMPQIVRKIEKDHEDEAKQLAQDWIDKLVTRIRAEGVDCEGLIVLGDSPDEEIIGLADQRKCDLIIMASHGHKGLNAVLMGSETLKVLTHSKIPVLIVK